MLFRSSLILSLHSSVNSFKGENDKKKKKINQRITSVDSQAFREVTFLFTGEGGWGRGWHHVKQREK